MTKKNHQSLVALVVLPFFAWMALYPSWALALNAFDQGQEAGLNFLPSQQNIYDENSQTLGLDTGASTPVSININELFPGLAGSVDTTDIASLYENEDAIGSGVEHTIDTLKDEESMTGEAFRTIYDGMQSSSRPNMQNDPIWNTTDNVLVDVFAGEYSDCNLTMSTSRMSKTSHVPDYKTCARMQKEASCDIERFVTLIRTVFPECPDGYEYNHEQKSCFWTGGASVSDSSIFEKYAENSPRFERPNNDSIHPPTMLSDKKEMISYFTKKHINEEGDEEHVFSYASIFINEDSELENRQIIAVDILRHTGKREIYTKLDSNIAGNPTSDKNFSVVQVDKIDLDGQALSYVNYEQKIQKEALLTSDVVPNRKEYKVRVWLQSYNITIGRTCVATMETDYSCFTNTVISVFDPKTHHIVMLRSGLNSMDVDIPPNGSHVYYTPKGTKITVENITPPSIPASCPAGSTYIPSQDICLVDMDEHFKHTPAGCGINNDFCQNDDETWECLIEDNARVYNGVMLTPEVAQIAGAKPLYPGDTLDRVCWLAQVDRNCNFNKGEMDCWTDIFGDEQCPINEGDNLANPDPELNPDGSYEEIEASCEVLEENLACRFIRSQCVEGAEGDNGRCYVFEDIYDCGESVTLDDISVSEEIVCDDDFICPAGNCVSHEPMPNTSFNEAVANLQVAEYAMQDMVCDPAALAGIEDSCLIFSGNPYECKIALGGWTDCCDMPVQQDVQTYMDMLGATSKLKSSMLAGDLAAQEGVGWGSWFEIGEGTSSYTSGWGVAQNAGSYYRIINGAVNGDWMSVGTGAAEMVVKHYAKEVVTDMARDSVVDAIFSEIKQQLLDKLAEWITELVGENVAGMIAEAAGGVAVDEVATQLTGELLANLIGSIVSFVMWIYLIYQIANIIVMLIYKCEEEEIELATKEAMGTCTYLGSYCASENVFGCIVRKKSYCCYETPLSRIIMEQAKPQLAGTVSAFGTASNPNCDGMTLGDMASLDWSKIDMFEWLAMLMTTGNLPSANDFNFSMDGLTGSGSALNLNLKSGNNTSTVTHEGDTTQMTFDTRPDVLTRTLDRLDGVPLEQTNQELRQDLYRIAPDLVTTPRL